MKSKSSYKHKSKLDEIASILIPPSLVVLLTITIYDLFFHTGVGLTYFISIFDIYIIALFSVDLYFRYMEEKAFLPWVKKYWLDIIATIPFNFLFLGMQGLALTRGLRGIRILRAVLRSGRYLRLVARLPRFLRFRKNIKKGKDVERLKNTHEKTMQGVLPFKVILLITVNSIMGTGIYFLTAAGAKHAGPASLISWAVLSLISLYIAMCFSELTAMFPKAGGVYEFAKQAYGRFWSFAIAWMTAIAGNVTIAMLLLGALQYLIPNHPQYYIPIAIALIVAFNVVAYVGLKTGVFVLVTFALITLATVLGLIVPGIFSVDMSNFSPFFVLPSFSIVLTIFFIAETFFGWESAVFLSAETKDPAKVMPRALIIGTFIIATLALLLAFVSMGVVPWQTYGESTAPLAELAGAIFGGAGSVIFTILVFISIIGAVACWVVTSPRLLMSVAEEKLFFVQFAKVHPKYKSPYVSIAFQVITLIILVIVGSGNYETLLHMLVPIILLIYSAVLLAVVILRFKKPDLKRPYKVPFGKVGPLFTILFMLFLLVMFTRETHHPWEILKISLALVLFGVPAYFAIEMFYEIKYITLRRALFARIRHVFNKVPKPQPAYKKILSVTGPYNKNTVIVDSNSPMGVISHMIYRKGLDYKKHHIFCSSNEESSHLLSIIKKQSRVKKVDVHKVKIGFIPKNLEKIDVFISHNDLGQVENVKKYLIGVKGILRAGSKYCFYVTHHFLDVAPNSNLIENKEELFKVFNSAGFKGMKYFVVKYPLREDIFVYGVVSKKKK